MQAGGAVSQSLGRGRHNREDPVINFDRGQSFFSLFASFCNYGRNRIADIAHAVRGKDRTSPGYSHWVRWEMTFSAARDPDAGQRHKLPGQICRCYDTQNAWHPQCIRHIDTHQLGMCVGRT